MLGIALLLLPLGTVRARAQQMPQDWPPDDTYNGQQQYAPGPQYAQPQYQQPQYPQAQYGQQQYAPQYGQQGYGQPQYGEPTYAPQYPQEGYAQQPYQGSQQGYPQQGEMQGQALNPEELEQLVAPIALYPDTLVAQILAASTYPAQVAAADEWLQAQGNAPPEQVAEGANAQTTWDPSVKALTAFPQVLAMMDRNLQWTTNLGNAYYNQPQDVLQTIQVMRGRAEQAGNLQSTPQADVNNEQGYIDIAPANPQVVYVPSYNPWDVYGQPVSPYPGFSLLGALGSFFGSSPVQYGLGIAMNGFMNAPWGWLSWGLDWLGHAILFNHSDYWTNSRTVADWGFPHGGPRAYGGWRDGGRGREGYGVERGSYGRDGYDRQRADYGRAGSGYGSGFARPVGRPAHSFGDARTEEGFNRGFPARGVYGRPMQPEQTYRNFAAPRGREEQFASRGFGSGYGAGAYGRQRENFGGRSGMTYSAPSRTFRQQEPMYQRGEFGGRGYGGYQGFNQKPQHSGGFHLFGHGHESNGFSDGGRESRSFSYGGHGSRGFKAPKAPHFSGGGHFHGGGHFGGHSGGHSSSHGGGHHR